MNSERLNPHPLGLAIHTTSPQLGLCISNFTQDTRHQTWDLGQEISTHLQPYLQDFLVPHSWTDLSFIGIAKGPGSFTGTRIGVVTARTLAQQLNIPLFAISTLQGIALEEIISTAPQTALGIQMSARRGQLFVGVYQQTSEGQLHTLIPDTTMMPEEWEQTLNQLNCPYQVLEAPLKVGDTSPSILKLAYHQWQEGKQGHWSEALPFYGQHPVP